MTVRYEVDNFADEHVWFRLQAHLDSQASPNKRLVSVTATSPVLVWLVWEIREERHEA